MDYKVYKYKEHLITFGHAEYEKNIMVNVSDIANIYNSSDVTLWFGTKWYLGTEDDEGYYDPVSLSDLYLMKDAFWMKDYLALQYANYHSQELVKWLLSMIVEIKKFNT